MLDSFTGSKTKSSREAETNKFEFALESFRDSCLHRVMYELAGIDDFHPDFNVMAKKLGISVDEARTTFEDLLVLGVVKLVDGKYVRQPLGVLDQPSKEIRIARHSLMSQQLLNKLTPNQLSSTRFFFARGNANDLYKLAERIKDAFDEFAASGEENGSDSVYGLSFTGVNLLDEGDKK